jgi:hypothetical protein
MNNTKRLLKSFTRGITVDGDPMRLSESKASTGTGGGMKKQATKQKPIPVRIVNDEPSNAPSPVGEKYKPTMSFDCSPTLPLPKLGATVRVTVTGTVIEASRRKDRYGDNKSKGRIEIEYPGISAVKVHQVGTSPDEIDDSDDAMGM